MEYKATKNGLKKIKDKPIWVKTSCGAIKVKPENPFYTTIIHYGDYSLTKTK